MLTIKRLLTAFLILMLAGTCILAQNVSQVSQLNGLWVLDVKATQEFIPGFMQDARQQDFPPPMQVVINENKRTITILITGRAPDTASYTVADQNTAAIQVDDGKGEFWVQSGKLYISDIRDGQRESTLVFQRLD